MSTRELLYDKQHSNVPEAITKKQVCLIMHGLHTSLMCVPAQDCSTVLTPVRSRLHMDATTN